MRCECCNRRKKLFESYINLEHEGTQVALCAGCNDLLLKIRDSFNDNLKNKNIELIQTLNERRHKASTQFLKWQEYFLSMYDLS